MKRVMMMSAVAAVLAAQAVAAAAEPASASFRINGKVPTICQAQFTQPVSVEANGELSFGSLVQLCNQMDGFRVVMQHPAGLSAATVKVDGVPRPLSQGTETVILDVDRPVEQRSNVALVLAPGQVLPASISIRVEPKGFVY